MSRADAAREKAVRLASMRHAATADPEAPAKPAASGAANVPERPRPAPAPRQAMRVKPVRMTLDLAPELHADFGQWTGQAARKTGRVKVNGSDVMRVLIRELLDNPELASTVLERLQREGS